MIINTQAKNESIVTKFSDAIALLKQDHRNVEHAFASYEKLTAGEHKKKKELADHICDELLAHMKVEEEIFYPSVKENVNDSEDSVNEGVVEHAGVKDLIEQIKAMKGNEELFDTKVHVLSEQIEHHVKEEEKEMFPKVLESDLDIESLGEEIAQRKSELS